MSSSNEYSGLIFFGFWFALLAVQGTLKSPNLKASIQFRRSEKLTTNVIFKKFFLNGSVQDNGFFCVSMPLNVLFSLLGMPFLATPLLFVLLG